MINSEEFEAFFNQQEKETAKENERQKNYIKALESALMMIAFKQFPEIEPHRKVIIKQLKNEFHSICVEMNELMDCYMNTEEDPNTEPVNYTMLEPDTEESEQKYLQEVLKTIPPERHKQFIELDAERSKLAIQRSSFRFTCHNKIKELTFQYFPELVDLSSNAILNINFSSYCATGRLTEAFFYVTTEYRD